MSDTVFEKQGNTLTVRPKGRLDTVSSPVLDREVQPYVADVQEIIFDFTDVDYISSGGLRVLLGLEQNLEQRGGEVRVIHANSSVLKILDLVGFSEVVTVVPD